jgi:ribosomal protein L11 methylase PrmA
MLSPTLYTNIKLLARYEGKHTGPGTESAAKGTLSKKSQARLLDSLYAYIEGLKANSATEWDHYYNQLNYSDASYVEKKALVKQWFSSFEGKKILDIGGNDGTFSREIPEAELLIVADVDPNAVEQDYRTILKNKEKNILPLVADFLNPAAGYGFNNTERFSLLQRLKEFKLSGCMALAVIHHITLSGNIPFSFSAKFFAEVAPNLLIEFPTRSDSWVQFLLKSKREFEGHFDFYNEQDFEKEFAAYFNIVNKRLIPGSDRILYSMKRLNNNGQE